MYGLRALHYHGLIKQKQGYYAKYKTAFFEKNEFDVIFLGSSRSEVHYNPKTFDSITGKNSFNLGVSGATPKVAYAVLKAYLYKSKMPEDLVYEVDYQLLKYEAHEIKQFNNFFPFLSNPVLLDEFSKIDPRMRHFYYNPYYSFSYTGFKNLSSSLHGWMNIPNKTDTAYYKGFMRDVFSAPLDYNSSKPYFSWINVVERNYLDSIILICKKNNTRIILTSSPIFGGGKLSVVNKPQVVSQIRNIAAIHKIDYYDFSSLPFCNQRELFNDHDHMNAAGSDKYTKIFSLFYHNKIGLKSLNH
jgi:hypothetical protein